MQQDILDQLEIRWLLEKWVMWRDGADWDRFATVWHPDARMVATWFDGPAADFIAHCRAAAVSGRGSNHALGGSVIDLAGDRALAETKMTITSRVTLHGEPVDVECTGRFYDFLDKRDGAWRFAQRQCIYLRDHIVPLTPGRTVPLDPARLATFPEGYRHLGYIQELAGQPVSRDLPGRAGAALDRLHARGRAWLSGLPVSPPPS